MRTLTVCKQHGDLGRNVLGVKDQHLALGEESGVLLGEARSELVDGTEAVPAVDDEETPVAKLEQLERRGAALLKPCRAEDGAVGQQWYKHNVTSVVRRTHTPRAALARTSVR